MKTRILIISGALALAGVGLLATPTPSVVSPVFNTGVASGTGCIGTVTLTAGCTLAPHASTTIQGWTITKVPSGSKTPVVITAAGGPPVSNLWLADNTTSRWLRPKNGTPPFTGNDADPVGWYEWTQTFTLTAAQANATVLMEGRFATDDQASININGQYVAATPANTSSFTTWTPFTIDGGFVAGTNTLTISTRNLSATGARAATGIRVEFSKVVLPEGGETVALTMGLGLILFLANRKKQMVVPAA